MQYIQEKQKIKKKHNTRKTQLDTTGHKKVVINLQLKYVTKYCKSIHVYKLRGPAPILLLSNPYPVPV